MNETLGVDNELILQSTQTSEGAYVSIILTDVYEEIGHICYDYVRNEYVGNLSYFIYEEYRNKGYAKRALRLFIRNFYKIDDKDLYLAILPDNKASMKVAIDSGATLEQKVRIPKNYVFSEGGKYKYANMYVIDMGGNDEQEFKHKKNI